MSHKSEAKHALSLFDPAIMRSAAIDSFKKLAPHHLAANPVIFVTEVVAALVTFLWLRSIVLSSGEPLFSGQIALWLWFTVLFATFAEAVAEGRGKAQAATLRATRSDTIAKRLMDPDGSAHLSAVIETVPALELRAGDVVLVEAGDIIPSDGDIIEGVASVNESAITGESAPVIREAGGDRCAVTGGTTVLSDWIKVRITAQPGNTFIDRMIALVEGAERQKTPNELALSVLLAGLTLIFLIAVVTLWGFASYSGATVSVTVLVALLVTLIPTTIGGLLSAIGIAGMDRLVRFNVLATSGRAVEAAGDVDTLLLDKTGTITFGNRMASEFIPMPGVSASGLAEAALAASLGDETPEGRSIVALAKGEFGAAGARLRRRRADHRALRRADPPLRRSTPAAVRSARARWRRCCASSACRRIRRRRNSRRAWSASAIAAARRSPSPTREGCSASSTSRTWSSQASASASPLCAPWASRP